MKIYSARGVSEEVYTDGLSNGGEARYFPTRRAAIASAMSISTGTDIEIEIEEHTITRLDAETVANLLNSEHWCAESHRIGVIKGGHLTMGIIVP